MPSRVKFDTYVDEEMELTDTTHEIVKIGSSEIDIKYSSRGKLVIVNSGGGLGYSLCKRCGYIIPTKPNTSKKIKEVNKTHKTKDRKSISATILSPM